MAQQDDTEMVLSGFGKTVSVKGVLGVVILIILVLCGFLGWLLYNLSSAASVAVSAAVNVQNQTVVEHHAIMDALKTIKNAYVELDETVSKVDSSVKTQNYILLSEPDEKAKIKRKMQMPKELRELMNDR